MRIYLTIEVMMRGVFLDNSNIIILNSAILLLSGVVAIIIASCFNKAKLKSAANRYFSFAWTILAAGGIASAVLLMIWKNGIGIAGSIAEIIYLITGYGAEALYAFYLVARREKEGNKESSIAFKIVPAFFCLVSVAIGIVGIFKETLAMPQGVSAYGDMAYWLNHIGDWVFLGFSAAILILVMDRQAERSKWILIIPAVMVFLAAIMEPVALGIALRFTALVIGLLVVYVKDHLKAEYREEGQEVRDLHNRIALMTGRMKPHYIYNVLTTIYYLCESDPEQAQSAVGSFSDYLRNTLIMMDDPGLVPFTQELDQIRSYLALEKLRFGDRLNIKYDIDTEDFNIPPLTVEPVVENAVKHGIRHLDGTGTVCIITRRLAGDRVQIKVIDDGVGFDTSKLKGGGDTEYELPGIMERIRKSVNGEMNIESILGHGTTVTITMEKRDL